MYGYDLRKNENELPGICYKIEMLNIEMGHRQQGICRLAVDKD